MDGCGEISTIDVPIKYGSEDRVVASLGASHTVNKLHTLPMMAIYMTGLELAPDRQHGIGNVDTKSYLEQGGVYPDDVKAIQRQMPVPYNMMMELSIYSSNTDQAFQILEQILLLFDYDLQIQLNDAPFDWTKLTKVTLTGINNEEAYPAGVDKRMIIWSLNFEVPIWLSNPARVREDVIKNIRLTIGDMDSLVLNEIDENGNLAPFSDPPLAEIALVPITANDEPSFDDGTPIL